MQRSLVLRAGNVRAGGLLGDVECPASGADAGDGRIPQIDDQVTKALAQEPEADELRTGHELHLTAVMTLPYKECSREVKDVPAVLPRGIFISYRRADSMPYARLLLSELSSRFPGSRVFMDLDSIEAGLDFAAVIREAISSCPVMVVLIGRQWATITDEEGRRRLDDHDDYVRFEIRTALRRGTRVIPVLVDGARPVGREQLPPDLRKLARLNALEMSCDRYKYDADRLSTVIENALAQ